jgi:zinc and cadmium transporter
MIIEILIATLLIMTVSLSGVIFVHQTARSFFNKNLTNLVSFSAGVFLVTAGVLTLESFELFSSPIYATLWILTGYASAWLMQFILPETHHHHDADCNHLHKGAKRLLIGDSIHNTSDGIVLVTAFLASPVLGITVTASIMIHEILQEVSEFFVLKQAGYTTKRALTLNLLTASTIFIGVILAYTLSKTAQIEHILLALSAGFFLHVVVHDLLPAKNHHDVKAGLLKHILLLAMGVVAMLMINLLLGETHEHGDHHDDDHHHPEEDHDLHH